MLTAEIPKLEAREVARDAMFGYIELSADSLWGIMEQAGVPEDERLRHFAARGAVMSAAGMKPDYPRAYNAIRSKSAAERKPSGLRPKTAAQLLDEAEQ